LAATLPRPTGARADDERSLRDVGLTRYDALYEARKPFWE
jgi:uncharacterized protein YjiS (DUF1127 family)